ncbi:MAG: hypothetical protein R3B13_06245 [Polyangiaceae bacterium]
MYEFLRLGGVPMIFVLLFGALTLAAAVTFARRPMERMVGMIRGMSIATVFVVLSGVASGLVATFTRVPQTPEWANDPKVSLIIVTGIGESLTIAIVGFSFLAIAWLVTALGVRRMGQVA